MYKSAYTFGLYLMALLIVLSTVAAALIGNTNLFSDAMASEKYSDRYDNYQEYENYSDDENNYRTNYDDNYYYQDQQPQSSYSNNYGYDDNKKISYSNSYDNDDSKYSNYPTKDKKYVCQTGQFEGFFVESVEFCLSHNKPPVPPTPINNNSTLVNTFNCINPNVININTETNQSSSSLNGLLQPIQVTAVQGLNGNLDELSQIDLNKANVNLCIINDNDNIVIGGDNATNGVGTPNFCDQCFNSIRFGGSIPPDLRDDLDRYLATTLVNVGNAPAQVVGHVAGLCDLINAQDGITVAQVTTILTNAFHRSDPNAIVGVIECLEELELILF